MVSRDLIYPFRYIKALLKATVLNFVVGNADNHNKNFSLIIGKDKTGTVQAAIAPFYDILPTFLFTMGDDEETALTICKKKSNLKSEKFYELAERVPGGIKILETCVSDLRSQKDFIITTPEAS